ncbi:copper ion binding protein [Lederbergia galactosidilytica]|uniref:Copper chaperone CopZ n=1 Tax=Lederbergia galactosidilytica TaxID=217031 RepID=A0A0Q9XWK8_9BACI|nr:copper ion binding protein [Lederbergia galactosidilytica]KRG12917.1 hypothetical protein ACA29_10215 [Lederbergia galactosidilytica]MBP1916333.1 copper chaperone [Lederbergia galactosidilytica]OAK70659.1 hypothetical protein ABB05_11790 [Lederbergia galactosidilytica]
MQQVTLNVQGMSCRSCVNKIEENIGKLNGVESVKVRLSEGKVDVIFIENIIELREIKTAIKDNGYEVLEKPTEESSSCSCCH